MHFIQKLLEQQNSNKKEVDLEKEGVLRVGEREEEKESERELCKVESNRRRLKWFWNRNRYQKLRPCTDVSPTLKVLFYYCSNERFFSSLLFSLFSVDDSLELLKGIPDYRVFSLIIFYWRLKLLQLQGRYKYM
jgi:hypothetical protein